MINRIRRWPEITRAYLKAVIKEDMIKWDIKNLHKQRLKPALLYLTANLVGWFTEMFIPTCLIPMIWVIYNKTIYAIIKRYI